MLVFISTVCQDLFFKLVVAIHELLLLLQCTSLEDPVIISSTRPSMSTDRDKDLALLMTALIVVGLVVVVLCKVASRLYRAFTDRRAERNHVLPSTDL